MLLSGHFEALLSASERAVGFAPEDTNDRSHIMSKGYRVWLCEVLRQGKSYRNVRKRLIRVTQKPQVPRYSSSEATWGSTI